MWNYNFRKKQTHSCATTRRRLSMQLEGDLPPAEAEELAAHLAGCAECRRWAGAEQALHRRLLAEVEPPWIMPPAARAYNRSQIRRRLRRKKLMLQTRQAVRGLAALVMLLLFAAAVFWWWQNYDLESLAPINTPIPQETEQVTITLAVEGSSLNRYRPLIEAFEQENPHIRVRLVNISDVADPDESGIRALATSSDVFPYSPNRQGESQYLLDLRPLLNLDSQFDAADFLPGLFPPATEPLWAIPTGAAYYLTFFDKSAFDDAGLSHPDLDWTTGDFLDAALALTVREGDEVTRWGYVPGQMRYPPLLASQLAAPLTTPDGSLRLADPDVVAAVQWLSDLFTLHEVSPWLEEYKPADRRSGSSGQTASALINSGQVTMWHFTHLLFDANDENVGVTAVPHGPHGLAAEPIIYGFAASRGTAHPEAAWQLLHFLSRQPPQEAWADLITPARRSVAAANSYWEQLPDSLAPALRYTAENNSPPRISFQAANLLQEAITVHIDDNVPAVAALDHQSEEIASTPPEETEVEVIAVPEVELEDERIQITFATSWGLSEAHQRLAREFNENQAEVQVTVQRIDTGNNFYTEIVGADCFAGFSSQHQRIGPYVRSLNALFDLDPELGLDDFYAAAITALTLEGDLWGMPGMFHVPLIAYNRALFAAAGIDEPSPDWTLTEFLEIAQALTDPDREQYGFIDATQHSSLNHGMAQFGISWITASNGAATVDYAAVAPVVYWYTDLVALYGVHPVLPGDLVPWRDFFDRHDIFIEMIQNEQVAMWPNEEDTTRRYIPHIEVGQVPFPRGPSGYSSSLVDNYTAYFIAADTQHARPCWQWLKFLVTQPAAVSSISNVPAHIATAESAAFADHVGAERATLLLTAIAAGSDRGTWLAQYEPWLNPATIWLDTATARAARGEVDVDSALADAADKFIRYRECVIERQAFETYTEWRACALEVDPDLGRRYN
jgi:ABC-type glycerol-3-phosphate transport system substrate-binding protein